MERDIDCVVIGLNVEATLLPCLQHVQKSHFPGSFSTTYVDSGSSDQSVAIAKNAGVQVIELHPEHPSPGMARNAGWKAGKAPFVQFVDADTYLDPHWMVSALDQMKDKVGAVQGLLRERYPQDSWYNWIADLEWNRPAGMCSAFGGNVFMRREVLEQTGGYDPVLVGGEEQELSDRVARRGWKIMQLDVPMGSHDIAMHTFRRYWKRTYRTGYGFAAAYFQGDGTEKSIFRVLIRGGGAILGLALLAILHPVGILFAFVCLCYPRLFSVTKLKKQKNLSDKEAKSYAWHCSFVVIPQFFGVMRYFFSNPLRNRR